MGLAEQLTRIIPADISGVGITGTTAVLGRLTADQSDFRFIAQVTNHSARRQCFIDTKTFDFVDTAGAVKSAIVQEFISGSVGQLKDEIMCTSTCLDMGETGYLLSLPSGVPKFDAVASVRIRLTAATSDWVAPPLKILPVAYDSPACNKPFTITVANQGTVGGTLNGLSRVVFFDEAGTLAFWEFLSSGTSTSNHPPNLGPAKLTTWFQTAAATCGPAVPRAY